jgi:hypothetical protein
MTSSTLLLLYLVLGATLLRALLVQAHVVPRCCGRCALPLERQELGGRMCRCGRQ